MSSPPPSSPPSPSPVSSPTAASASASASVIASASPAQEVSASLSNGTTGEQRNTEIWSTRLQRELLAMTTDNATEEAKKQMTAVLPPFCIVKEHSLDIERGNCTVTCLLDLPKAAAAVVNTNTNTNINDDDDKAETETKTELEEEDKAVAESESETTESSKEKASEATAAATTTTEDNESPAASAPITITLDVSLQKKANGISVDASAVSYPFMKPVAILSSGCANFPTGSTIQNGDLVDIEMDWTPSLHLTDAILNIALKIKESLSQGEPFHAAEPAQSDNNKASKTELAVNEAVNKAKKFGSSFGASLRNLAKTTSESAASASATASAASTDKPKKSRLSFKKKKAARPKATATEIRIGDEINMLEVPWVDCQGVYSCKAIRRPKFVEEAIKLAEPKEKKKNDNDAGNQEVANAGFAGAGAMFRSFTNSTRGLLEESFLMITESHIIEMRSNKLNLSTGTVTFAIPIEMMAKLKFRRQESVSLFFKLAPDDPLIYMCPDSADCVHQIQSVLKRHGVKGKHTNAATHRAINQALHLVQEIQTKELALKHDPSIDRVNEIMDLYRQAAERFEVAGDVRHEEVVIHMRKFLALPLTVSVLDGSYQKPVDHSDNEPIVSTTSPGKGAVLSSENEAVTKEKSESAKEDKKFDDNMDNLLAEAEADLANMKVDGEEDPELDAMLNEEDGGLESADDAIADFENMLKEADDELAELMNS